MRAPFIHTMDIYLGDPLGAVPPPIIIAADRPCRLVPQSEILNAGLIPSISHEWLTYSGQPILGPEVDVFLGSGEYYVRQWPASVIHVKGDIDRWFSVAMIQDCLVGQPGFYRRAILIPYPLEF